MCFANIFSQSVACLFIFLMKYFEMWKFWIIMSNLSIFSFMDHVLVSYRKKIFAKFKVLRIFYAYF